MANTTVTYQGNGVTTDFAITFDYLARKFVRVDIDGTLRTNGVEYNFIDARTISFVSAPAQGTLITIRRNTSATERIVEFRDASVLKASDLDLSSLQTFHIAEEAKDLVLDTIGTNEDGDLDARFRKIVNLKDGVNPNDAINYGQYTEDREGPYQAALAAKASEVAAKASEVAAKASEDNAKASEVTASASAATAVVAAMDAQQSESDTLALKTQTQQIVDQAQGSLDQIAEINSLANDVKGARLPVGVIVPFPETGDYPGYLYLDGSAFDKATYAQLAAIYPTGILPDLRGASLNSYTVYWYIKAVDSVGQPEVIQAQQLVTRVAALESTKDEMAKTMASALFYKADPTTVAFTKTGAGTASIKAGTKVGVAGTVVTFVAATAITMPTLTAGTDYAIWVKDDGTIQASSSHTSAPGAGNWRKIGGFHYAPGGNATAQAGGNTTPQINEYSFWDLKFRPTCSDPRGMTLVGGRYWVDIYLTGVDAITNGSSKYNVTMADGSSPPKVPTMFGGNGTTNYGTYTWFEAMELATAFGKRCPNQQEFMSAMYGTTEASSIGTDQVSTILNAAYTSKWGVIQATGVLWVYGVERGGPYAGATWNANTEGRGSEYNAPTVALFGGLWVSASNSGSRCSAWANAASISGHDVGSRFVSDHLQLD